MQDFRQDGTCPADKTFHRNHHQNQTHQPHHDVVTRLADKFHQLACPSQKAKRNDIHQYDSHNQGRFHFKRMGFLHQDNRIGNRTRPA